MNLFRHIPTIQMFDHTIAYYDNWFNFDDDDDDDDGDEDGDDDDGNDNNDDDDDDKDDDNVDGDEEDDVEDDDKWLLFCNSSMSLHLANWFNNELIISSLDFNCFRRK